MTTVSVQKLLPFVRRKSLKLAFLSKTAPSGIGGPKKGISVLLDTATLNVKWKGQELGKGQVEGENNHSELQSPFTIHTFGLFIVA